MAYRPPVPGSRNDNRRIIVYIVGAVLVLGLLALAYLALFTDTFAGESFATSKLPMTAQIAATEDRVYYLDGTTVVCADEMGEVFWEYPVSGSSMEIEASDEVVCVYTDKSAVAINPEGHALFNIAPADFSIESVACGNSSVAFLTTAPEGNDYIRVIDLAGTQIDSIELTELVLQYGISGSSDNLWRLTLDTSGVTPVSNVITRSPKIQSIMGTLPVSDQLISQVYVTEEHMILSGTTSHMVYNNNGGDKQSEITIYGLSCIDTYETEEDYVFLYTLTESEGANHVARVITLSGTDKLIQLPEGVRDLVVDSEHLYCFADDVISVYDFTGRFVRDIDLASNSIKKLSGSVLVNNEEGVFSLPLN